MSYYIKSLILAVLLITPRLFASESNIPQLELKILCDKATYMVGEPIWVDILVINHGDDTITADPPAPEGDCFRFIVVENSKDTLVYGGIIAEYLTPPTCQLAPGDTLYNVYNLSYAYSSSSKSTIYRDIPLKGDVSVSAIYRNYYISNTLNIEITGVSEAERDSYKLWSKEVPPSRAKEHYLKLFENSSSVYAEAACYELVQWNRGFSESDPDRDIEKAKHYATIMMEQYPNSGYMKVVLYVYLQGLSKESRLTILDSLQTLDRPFRLRMIARNIQRGISSY